MRAVDDVSLDIGEREVVGLVGESGCGKSTLGRGILGLLPHGARAVGEVNLDGQNLYELPPSAFRRFRGPQLGLIFQEPMTRLNPLMRISEHFSETLKQHEPKLSDGDIERRSLETLGRMGIPPTRYEQYPHEFSGGMRQRIMIALALVLRPKVLVADEPTTSLDVIVEGQILALLADLKKNFGTALLLITHNLGIVAEACDRMAVMYAGKIVEEGPVRDVFREPAGTRTRASCFARRSRSTKQLARPSLGARARDRAEAVRDQERRRSVGVRHSARFNDHVEPGARRLRSLARSTSARATIRSAVRPRTRADTARSASAAHPAERLERGLDVAVRELRRLLQRLR